MILDANSNPVTSTNKLIHGSSQSRYRGPQFQLQNKSLDDLISERDRDVVVALSQRLFLNMGPFKSVVDQKASYSVGVAWLPTYKGEDREQGGEVESWLTNSFFKSLDLRGQSWDWWENLESVSYEIDVRGDHFTLLTTDETGKFPRIKNIPAHAVRTKDADKKYGEQCTVNSGQHKGRRIIYGIIYDDNDKPLAYRVSTGQGQADYKDIDAASMIHSFDPTLSDGRRGLPVASHALEDLKHILQSTEYERSRQLIMSSIGLFVENDTGGPELGDPRNDILGTPATADGLTTQEISPQVWYAQAGNGNKITQLRHEAGGDSFSSFHDRMIRSFVSGARWSYSLTWKPTGQGTAERGEILRARKAIISRQKRLNAWATRVITYAYSFANKQGALPDLENPFAWEFTRPPRLSVDDGRESKMMMEGFRLGKENMSDLLEAEGRTYDDHLNNRAMEAVKRKLKIAQIQDEFGVQIDERELVMFTPNDQAQASMPQGVETPEHDDDDSIKFENLKAKFDAYGVAVRAGAITPSIDDEVTFRDQGGLPSMSDAVKGAWSEDKGFRRPITIVSGSTAPPTAAVTDQEE